LEQGGAADEFSAVLAAARRGDPAARARLYANYWAQVVSVVHRRFPDALRARYDTMDFAQSVFAEVLRDLPRIEDRGERAFVGLLRLKAVNKLRRRMKHDLGRGGRRAQTPLPDDIAETAGRVAESSVESREDDVKLRGLLTRLDETSREILSLRTDGKSFAEIAAAMRLPSAGAARKRHDRALARLRALWESGTSRPDVR
jgi:RNA polymerase sigma factor (sigma-70 family)